jgi:hypothetical protein
MSRTLENVAVRPCAQSRPNPFIRLIHRQQKETALRLLFPEIRNGSIRPLIEKRSVDQSNIRTMRGQQPKRILDVSCLSNHLHIRLAADHDSQAKSFGRLRARHHNSDAVRWTHCRDSPES